MTETQSANSQDVGHERLGAFAGTWRTEGQQYEGPVGPAGKIAAVETYEWLTGKIFLVHRFEGRVGDTDAACIEIIGHDAQSQNYPTHTFYDNGVSNRWESLERDGIWTLTGDWPMEGTSMKVRRTTVFGDSGNTMVSTWDHSSDGSKWQAFWDVTSTKMRRV